MFDDHLYAVPGDNIHSSLCHLGASHQGATSALQLLLGLPERQRATTLQLLLALPLSKKGWAFFALEIRPLFIGGGSAGSAMYRANYWDRSIQRVVYYLQRTALLFLLNFYFRKYPYTPPPGGV